MSKDAVEWVRTQVSAVCAPRTAFRRALPGGGDILTHILRDIYPVLIEQGYDLPLNVVVDLACLYLDPDRSVLEYRVHHSWPTLRDLGIMYCRVLNDATVRGPLHRVLGLVATAQRRREAAARGDAPRTYLPAAAADSGDSAPVNSLVFLPNRESLTKICSSERPASLGLVSFLELMASWLVRTSPPDPLPSHVREAVLRKVSFSGSASEPPPRHKGAVGHLTRFLQGLFRSEPASRRPFDEALAEEGRALLAIAGSRVGSGAEGVDLPLLQACLNYQPVGLDAGRSSRWHRLRQSVQPRQSRHSRSPEFGIHGINRRGAMNSVLRSYLARDDFVDRVLLKQVLFYDRYIPRETPNTVLIACVIDLGEAMQVRTSSGRRRDSLARQCGAFLIEDVVRHFIDVPAINLCVAAVLHDGNPAHPRAWWEMPEPEILHQAAPRAAGDPDRIVAWWPGVDHVMPFYFLRDPEGCWPPVGRIPPQPASARHRWAFDLLSGLSAVRAPEDTDGYPFDLLCAFVLGPTEGLPVSEEDRRDDLLRLSTIAPRVGVGYVRFDIGQVTTMPWPPRSRSTIEGYESFGRPDSDLRLALWDSLLNQLDTL